MVRGVAAELANGYVGGNCIKFHLSLLLLTKEFVLKIQNDCRKHYSPLIILDGVSPKESQQGSVPINSVSESVSGSPRNQTSRFFKSVSK